MEMGEYNELVYALQHGEEKLETFAYMWHLIIQMRVKI